MTNGPRRSPLPDARQRDSERTRHALLDAARAEFADKGLAGARVNAIARRAGVNQQLISYYFGGKQGLYQAILEHWHHQEEQLADPGISLGELAVRYLEAGHRQPDLQRLFVRDCLDQEVEAVPYEPDAPELADLHERQAAGEIADDLDPAFVLLVLQATVISGTLFPRDTKRLMGLDPASSEYLEHVGRQLRLLVRHLAQAPGGDDVAGVEHANRDEAGLRADLATGRAGTGR